jgi:uncharacterized protein (TIGR03086 family)
MTDIPELFRQAVERFGDSVDAIPAAGWTGPTPCTEWNVRDLVNHLASECRWMPPLFAGATIAEVGDALDGDLLGDDPVEAWREAGAGAVAAVAAPGAMEQTVHLSFGDVDGNRYAGDLVSDLTIHRWDLARAIGADEVLDPDLVRAAWNHLSPMAEAWRAAGAFAGAVEVADDVDQQTKLLALTGRRV